MPTVLQNKFKAWWDLTAANATATDEVAGLVSGSTTGTNMSTTAGGGPNGQDVVSFDNQDSRYEAAANAANGVVDYTTGVTICAWVKPKGSLASPGDCSGSRGHQCPAYLCPACS